VRKRDPLFVAELHKGSRHVSQGPGARGVWAMCNAACTFKLEKLSAGRHALPCVIDMKCRWGGYEVTHWPSCCTLYHMYYTQGRVFKAVWFVDSEP